MLGFAVQYTESRRAHTAGFYGVSADAAELLLSSQQARSCAAAGALVLAHHQPLGCLLCSRQLCSQPATVAIFSRSKI